MPFRNIIIDSRCKLEYSLNYLVCRKVEEEKKVLLDEIKTIIITSTQVSLTTSLISEISNHKIKLIFCDECHKPTCEIVPYQNNFYSYRKIKEQIALDDNIKAYLRKQIIQKKILNQAFNLKIKSKIDSYEKLIEYSKEITDGDLTNREGHSAKVYFNALFGTKYSRELDCNINMFLNYGYSILVSTISCEIKMLGYLTELGIHHIGESNSFNLSYDFVEPLRPLVDLHVIKNLVNEENFKTKFIEMLSLNVKYNDKEILLSNAMHLYIEDLMDFLKNGDVTKIKFIEYEL